MNTRFCFLVVGAALTTSAPALEPPAVPPADFARLHALIQPQPGESPWREIAWLTNVTAARQQSLSEDKPIVIFTAADGSPIGRT